MGDITVSEARTEPADPYDPLTSNVLLGLLGSMNEVQQRNYMRRNHVTTFQYTTWHRLFPWMKHPFLSYIMSFWIGLIDEGPRELLTPRWGGITFGWLNDGFSPTIWHTWRQLTHDQTDPYNAIYTYGAPRSLAEAQLFDEHWSEDGHGPFLVNGEWRVRTDDTNPDCRLCRVAPVAASTVGQGDPG